jgi:hypothetical protein
MAGFVGRLGTHVAGRSLSRIGWDDGHGNLYLSRCLSSRIRGQADRNRRRRRRSPRPGPPSARHLLGAVRRPSDPLPCVTGVREAVRVMRRRARVLAAVVVPLLLSALGVLPTAQALSLATDGPPTVAWRAAPADNSAPADEAGPRSYVVLAATGSGPEVDKRTQPGDRTSPGASRCSPAGTTPRVDSDHEPPGGTAWPGPSSSVSTWAADLSVRPSSCSMPPAAPIGVARQRAPPTATS